ncbi:polysaccharide deacetylase family protein [Gordonia shandongensis]|uniref:polysaccharide deacetylase family protein n=1 Tax=Gordonia shandongensis TaxID=376351 RepID=UPI0003F86D19|nr:polysaccharide deacetylase family protein [Gordonia shandongensis]
MRSTGIRAVGRFDAAPDDGCGAEGTDAAPPGVQDARSARRDRSASRPNHTWTHPALTSLTARGVTDELERTRRFLRNDFGVESAPYFRPPFGYRDAAVDRIAADLGYTVPVLWDGSLSDSGVITEKYLMAMARRYLRAQRIVIGHANHAPVTRVFGELQEIVTERRLNMLTLDDYFQRPIARR